MSAIARKVFVMTVGAGLPRPHSVRHCIQSSCFTVADRLMTAFNLHFARLAEPQESISARRQRSDCHQLAPSAQ